MDILMIILTSLLSVVALFIIAKIIGHKQLAQLDFFDYISGITIGSIAAELSTELEEPAKPLVALVVYGVVSIGLSLITHKLPKTRKYINGSPAILMSGGSIYRSNLKKAKLDLSEFMVMCREQGYFDLRDVQTAVLETNGKLSILPVSAKRPLTPEDMHLKPSEAHIGTELIMDGRILDENLKRMDLDSEWLNDRIAERGYKDAKEILLAVYYDGGELAMFAMQG